MVQYGIKDKIMKKPVFCETCIYLCKEKDFFPYYNIRFRVGGPDIISTTDLCRAECDDKLYEYDEPIGKVKRRFIIVNNPLDMNRGNNCTLYKRSIWKSIRVSLF